MLQSPEKPVVNDAQFVEARVVVGHEAGRAGQLIFDAEPRGVVGW